MIIDKRSMVPIYQQIINQYKTLIACNVISIGEQLDSVRGLSSELGINPNTIQKAYAELENQYICSSAPGKGRFVTADAKDIIKKHAAENTAGIEREIYGMALSGLNKDEILDIVEESYVKAQKKITAVKATVLRKDYSHD